MKSSKQSSVCVWGGGGGGLYVTGQVNNEKQ